MKILVADDHALIRSGLRSELAALEADSQFVEAWDLASLQSEFERHRDLDLALVDLNMPGMLGPRTIAALRETYPAVPIVVLSGVDAPAEVQAILRAGASGYIPKSSVAQIMLQAIRLVLAGGLYLPPLLMHEAEAVTTEPVEAPLAQAPANGKRGPDAGRLDRLSTRQKQVFALLARGLSNKMIARELQITESTVKSHVATIFDVLRVHNRVSAVAEARLLAGDLEGQLASGS